MTDLSILPQILKAADTHAGSVLRLHQEVLKEQEWFITYPEELAVSIHSKLRQIRDLRSHPCGLFLVATLEDEVVGLLTLAPGQLRRMRHAVKLEIMVSGACRGRGVGRALMERAMAWAVANPKVHKVGLSVFADNSRAVRLYQVFGFSQEGHRRQEYLDDDGTWRDDLLLFRMV